MELYFTTNVVGIKILCLIVYIGQSNIIVAIL